jgi:anaerobic magnesium-protoporphyrin IX monomethyl ester cyclase
LPTEKVSAAEVLRFRDEAFHTYFSSRRYLEMVSRRFGVETRRHVEEMARGRLRRHLLEASSGPASPVEPERGSHETGARV